MKLVLDGVYKSFNTKKVLNDASFIFEKGKIYALLGRNGAGKTTIFNCISEEIEYDEGKIYIEDDNKKVRDDVEIGFAYAEPILPEFLTGYEFIKFYIDIHKSTIKDNKSVDEWLDLIKINKDDRKRLIKGYSQGMKNKLQMLTFIISKPPIILLDEPLTSLDVVAAHEIKQMLLDMKDEHIIILSTHILQIAKDICDEVVLLNKGKLNAFENDNINNAEFEKQVMDILQEEYKDA